MDNMHSIGLFRKDQKAQVSDMAMRLIEKGYINVHIEILWTSEYNARALGPYVGFYANGCEPS